ncbi:MAG: hypothetical protein CMN76_12280 [Spirochaetaceae bacterium]|nr:hypothetical protein [Spirochaetaceae bacterium]
MAADTSAPGPGGDRDAATSELGKRQLVLLFPGKHLSFRSHGFIRQEPKKLENSLEPSPIPA